MLEDYCNFKRFKYLKLDGTTRSDDRGLLIEKFNAEDSECVAPLMLLCLDLLALSSITSSVLLVRFSVLFICSLLCFTRSLHFALSALIIFTLESLYLLSTPFALFWMLVALTLFALCTS